MNPLARGLKIGIVGTVCYAILVFVYVSVAAPLPSGVPFALGPEPTLTDPHLITMSVVLFIGAAAIAINADQTEWGKP